MNRYSFTFRLFLGLFMVLIGTSHSLNACRLSGHLTLENKIKNKDVDVVYFVNLSGLSNISTGSIRLKKMGEKHHIGRLCWQTKAYGEHLEIDKLDFMIDGKKITSCDVQVRTNSINVGIGFLTMHEKIGKVYRCDNNKITLTGACAHRMKKECENVKTCTKKNQCKKEKICRMKYAEPRSKKICKVTITKSEIK